MIKDLRDITLKDVNLFGGKAVNLGFLINNGFNVPPGFCISADATELSGETRTEIKEKFKTLGSYVSVRSSASCEDSKKMSFAGQFDTFLNVDSEDDLFDSIKKCWDSVNSGRVKAYAGDMKISMAVIVQKMLDPELSGVMFTLDPIYNKHILIEAAPGLGDNIVSGRITPSNFLIHRETFEIVDQKNMHGIDEGLIEKIAGIGKEIEHLYNSPQDIEFAVKKKVYILQSRPITA